MITSLERQAHVNLTSSSNVITSPVHLGHPQPLTLLGSGFSLLPPDFGTKVKPMTTSICFLLLYSCLRIYKQSVSYWAPSIVFPASVPSCHVVRSCCDLCLSAVSTKSEYACHLCAVRPETMHVDASAEAKCDNCQAILCHVMTFTLETHPEAQTSMLPVLHSHVDRKSRYL